MHSVDIQKILEQKRKEKKKKEERTEDEREGSKIMQGKKKVR